MRKLLTRFLAPFFLLFLSVGVLPAKALTLSEIQTLIRYNIRDTHATTPRYTDAMITGWVNDAQRDVVSLTWCIAASTSITLVAGTTYYDLPDEFLASRFVLMTRTGKATIQIKEVLEDSFLDDYPDYERTAQGLPTNYFVRQSLSGETPMEVAFIPIPTTSSTGTIRMDYFAYADDLSAGSDVPFNGLLSLVPYHKTLVDNVTTRIKVIEGRVEEAGFYRQEFDRGVAIMANKNGQNPNYRPSIRPATP